MRKSIDEPLKKIQLQLFTSDWTLLRKWHGDNIGVNECIRTLIRSYVRSVNAKADHEINELEKQSSI